MKTRIIVPNDYRSMPWKNGGGATTEIAISPKGAGLDDFDWRISMARVEADGPFSIFPGIDRTLSVLEGSGIKLRIAGEGDVTLKPGDAPYAFPADVAVDADLVAGGIDDLNVMTRRGRWRHRMAHIVLERDIVVHLRTGMTLLYLHRGRARIGGDDKFVVLETAHSLRMERGGDTLTLEPLEPLEPAEIYVIDLWTESSADRPNASAINS